MKIRSFFPLVIMALILLASCTQPAALSPTMKSAVSIIPTHGSITAGTAKPITPTVTPIISASYTSTPQSSTQTVDHLIDIIYASDPDLPQYDPASPQYAEFSDALQQLSAMGPGAIDAASHMGHAISFPRDDSYLAAEALISLGPGITATTLPVLIDNLLSQRPETRLYSVIVLGTVGEDASCAVDHIGPLLWDADPSVRFATAYVLAQITGRDLLPGDVIVVPDPLAPQSILSDTPEGKIVGIARRWWTAEGSTVNWHPSYGMCDP